MIVIPLSAAAPSLGVEPSAELPRARLRLLAPHEHTWELRAVDFDDGLEVRRYECCGCDDVQFR